MYEIVYSKQAVKDQDMIRKDKALCSDLQEIEKVLSRNLYSPPGVSTKHFKNKRAVFPPGNVVCFNGRHVCLWRRKIIQ